MSDSLQNVYDILRRSSGKWPRHTAIIDEFGMLDYMTLFQQVEEVRQRLCGKGVAKGMGVGIMGGNSRAFVIGAFAAVGCGAIVMPLSQRLGKMDLDEIREAAPPHAIIRCPDAPGNEAEGSADTVAIPGLRAPFQFCRKGAARQEGFAPFVADAAFVRFTSGTTNRAKGVVLSHTGIVERTAAANRGLELSADDTVLWVLPMAYHFFVSVILYLRYGCTIVICRDNLPETILLDAEKHGATFLYGAPVHYGMLAAHASKRQLRTLKRAVSTSIALPREIARGFFDRVGLPISQAYGVIEIGLPLINTDAPAERPESVGRPLPDYEVALFDEKGQRAPDGGIGELAVRGPGMFSAYLAPPRLREKVLREGWFMTGDLAERDAEGYVTLMGRSKSLINVGGQKVFPERIEAFLNLHPLVLTSRVTGRSHARLGEVVHADLVLRSGAEAAGAREEVIEYCCESLLPFEVPQSVTIVEEIRTTRSGKVTRR